MVVVAPHLVYGLAEDRKVALENVPHLLAVLIEAEDLLQPAVFYGIPGKALAGRELDLPLQILIEAGLDLGRAGAHAPRRRGLAPLLQLRA